MTWDVTKLPERRTALDVKTLAAYNRGEPLPRMAKARYEGPGSPTSEFYERLGWTRINASSNVICGLVTTPEPNTVKAFWGDLVYVDGRGWTPFEAIVAPPKKKQRKRRFRVEVEREIVERGWVSVLAEDRTQALRAADNVLASGDCQIHEMEQDADEWVAIELLDKVPPVTASA